MVHTSEHTEAREAQGEFLRSPIEAKKSRWGFRGKTVWDWLPVVGALLIPVMIAAGTWWITLQQARIEDQRAEAERTLAEQRAQDEALQAYLDQMSTLLLEKDLRLSTADNATEASKEARTLARARTLTVLASLDPIRKEAVMQFLTDANLVRRIDERAPVIELSGADLSNTEVVEADLSGANLTGAILNGADLRHANLTGADLNSARLNEADLRGANLSRARLIWADLRNADLRDGGPMNTNLKDADLYQADLSGAEGVTEAELEAETKNLECATMPDGRLIGTSCWIRNSS